MLKIYACVTHGINAAARESLLSGLSAGLRERLLGTKNETHKLERICAYALLDKLFTDSGYRKERAIRTDKLGKPYIEGVPLRFSLSHTDGLSLAAVCDEFEIGVDAELIKSECAERTASVCRRFLKNFEPSYKSLSENVYFELYGIGDSGELVLKSYKISDIAATASLGSLESGISATAPLGSLESGISATAPLGSFESSNSVAAPLEFSKSPVTDMSPCDKTSVGTPTDKINGENTESSAPIFDGIRNPYRRWVCAEAILKCSGGGLSSLASLESVKERTKLYEGEMLIGEDLYAVALATEVK